MASNPFFRRVRAVVVIGLVGGTIAMAMGAAPASAGLGLSCPSSTSTPFVPWSDNANYVFAPDGGFESGATGWVLPPEDPAELARAWATEMDGYGVARAALIASMPGDEASVETALGACDFL